MKNRNAWILLGTTMTWFLLDIAFCSQNLFLPDLLRTTGFSKFPDLPEGGVNACKGECAEAMWRGLFKSAVGNAVVAIIGTVPGYWFTVAFVDKWGRVPIQFMGFIMMTVMLIILAAIYPQLVPPPGSTSHISPWIFLVFYSMTFFFANFGPNSTTFIVPSEVFHTRYRSTLHGISAACGKMGAIGKRRERECVCVLCVGRCRRWRCGRDARLNGVIDSPNPPHPSHSRRLRFR